MLYKIFLLGVIIFSRISIGNIIVGEKEQRLKALSELENCIKAMRNGMVYQGMTFYEALKHTGRVDFLQTAPRASGSIPNGRPGRSMTKP